MINMNFFSIPNLSANTPVQFTWQPSQSFTNHKTLLVNSIPMSYWVSPCPVLYSVNHHKNIPHSLQNQPVAVTNSKPTIVVSPNIVGNQQFHLNPLNHTLSTTNAHMASITNPACIIQMPPRHASQAYNKAHHSLAFIKLPSANHEQDWHEQDWVVDKSRKIKYRKLLDKKWQCGTCRKIFKHSTPSMIARHHQTHLGEKPFVCSSKDCGKAFTRLCSLNRHIGHKHPRLKRVNSSTYGKHCADKKICNDSPCKKEQPSLDHFD